MPKTIAKIPIIVDTSEQVGHAWAFDPELFTEERFSLMTGRNKDY